MRIQVRLWLEKDGQMLYGLGRENLMEAIDRTGSLAGAARDLGMSYRGAWGRMKASEERLGFKLVDSRQKGRKGAQLTVQGRLFLERFKALRCRLEEEVRKAEKEWFADLGLVGGEND